MRGIGQKGIDSSNELIPYEELIPCEESFYYSSGIDSRKNAKNGQGIGIAILLESDSAQARESPGIC